MAESDHDPSLDTLLDLDGQIMVVDPDSRYWVRFEVKRVEPSLERPHGLKYSLTLHDAENHRLIGFDNAHPVRQSTGPGGRPKRARDHKHRFRAIRPYDYENAATLLADFWAEVDSILRERGIIP